MKSVISRSETRFLRKSYLISSWPLYSFSWRSGLSKMARFSQARFSRLIIAS
ncbi:MAG: hypothetical protein RSE13_04775 [Planktothrix sp. GU0601_MAG3]|nr:MAG: hypothetical protein RSE13_04775 [Planktothrix sp. GU0601_MAG3]